MIASRSLWLITRGGSTIICKSNSFCNIYHLKLISRTLVLQVSLCTSLCIDYLQSKQFLITVGNSSCGKVMFSQACVKNSVHRGGGMHTRGRAWQGACVAGGRVSQERRPLQRTVRILLECILVGMMYIMGQCLFSGSYSFDGYYIGA